MKIRIGHLYPDLLNLYSDRGNIRCLMQRCKWRGIEAETIEYKLEDDIDFENIDIILLGGGSDREQKLVCSRLTEIKDDFSKYVERQGVVIAVCGGYQLLGKSYKMGDEIIEGLNIVDIKTESGEGRLIGNIVIQSDLFDMPLVGFENHGGRTIIGDVKPLGKVISGFGNNDTDKQEGIIYKNVIGTYLHGPLLPKNPHLCDYLLEKALSNKYKNIKLAPLDDTLELRANKFIVDKYIKN
jgi:Predicted glutamine amidotransferase